jgi:predicted nucleic acid-binding protein
VTQFVIDASVALAWCFRDERTWVTERLRERVQTDAVAVPALWHLEVANVLALAERRGRITPAESVELITLPQTIEILVDEETASRAFGRVLDLAREERLTAMTRPIWSWRCGSASRSPPRMPICAMRPSASA